MKKSDRKHKVVEFGTTLVYIMGSFFGVSPGNSFVAVWRDCLQKQYLGTIGLHVQMEFPDPGLQL